MPTLKKALPKYRKHRASGQAVVTICGQDHYLGVDATLEELDDTLTAMIRVQRLTAMRPQEICLLTPGQIDRSADIWLCTPNRHKNEHHAKSRIIPIGPRAQAILLPYLLRGADEYCFQPPRSHRRHYTKDSYRERIWKACARAFPAPVGLSEKERAEWEKSHRWNPNQLRHSSGTEIRAKFGIEASRTVLGHSQVATTEIYAERDLKLAMDVAKAIG
jgi:integrase